MRWVALDRAIALAELDGYDDETSRSGASSATSCARRSSIAASKELGSFTQSYGSGTLDASNLMLAEVGFIAPDDARFVGTVRRPQEHLMRGWPRGPLRPWGTPTTASLARNEATFAI